MVAQMTNHNADYIWDRMPFAQGLQYQTAWYMLHFDPQKGMQRVPLSARMERAGIDTVI